MSEASPPRPHARSCNTSGRSLEPIIAAVTVQAREIGEFLGMASKVHLFIGLVERTIRGVELAFVVALESGARNHIENAVRPVALIGRIAAALGLQVVDILGSICGPTLLEMLVLGMGTPSMAHVPGGAAHVELVVLIQARGRSR